MNPTRAQEIIKQFIGKRLIVLGDFMLDEFIWGEVRRISPEAPVPVVEVKRESWQAGGAGNVVSNLLELGAQALPIGVIGNDSAGEKLAQRLTECGAFVESLVVDAARQTTVKTRIVAHHQQMIRADRESKLPLDEATEDRIIAAFSHALTQADAVIISDYEKGVVSPRVLEHVLSEASAKIVCLDPKIKNFAFYQPLTVITPNQLEAEKASGIEIHDEPSLRSAIRKIHETLDCPHVLVTRGEQGMTLSSIVQDRQTLTHIPTMAREVFDVTGAGDTVIATLALSLATGAVITEAAELANQAAGIVVGKLGTATVSQAELIGKFPL